MAKRTPNRRRRRQPLWLFPRIAERRFVASLRAIGPKKIRALVDEIILPRLSELVRQATILRPAAPVRTDAWPDEVNDLIERLRLGMEAVPTEAEQSAQEIALDISNVNRNQWRKIQRATLGVQIGIGEPWLQDQMRTFTSQNSALITKMSEDAIANIQGEIQRGLQAGLRVESIRERILDQVDVSYSKAQLIARDQVGKFNAQLTQLRQGELGIRRYVWRTSRDERVRGRPGGLYPKARPRHWSLEGKECSWSDPTVWYDAEGNERSRSSIQAVELHPGQDIQCRCTPEPVLEEILAE